MEPGIDELKKAYKKSQLKRCGISLVQALYNPMFRRQLTRLAEVALRKEAQGNAAPRQPQRRVLYAD
jgi:hypothetical protein